MPLRFLALHCLCALVACSSQGLEKPPANAPGLRINEVVSNNKAVSNPWCLASLTAHCGWRLNPSLFDQVYVNAQLGEALVTNPAPGILCDEFVYDPTVPQSVWYQHSTFSPERPVMTAEEQDLLSCNAFAIHEHFAPLLDPQQQNPWFAMDIEFKLIGPVAICCSNKPACIHLDKSCPRAGATCDPHLTPPAIHQWVLSAATRGA